MALSLPLRVELFLGFLAVFDDIARLEEDALQHSGPLRLAAAEGLEVHREVLELLALRVLHDRPGVGILLDIQALLVPADRLRLLDQRGANPGDRADLLR